MGTADCTDCADFLVSAFFVSYKRAENAKGAATSFEYDL